MLVPIGGLVQLPVLVAQVGQPLRRFGQPPRVERQRMLGQGVLDLDIMELGDLVGEFLDGVDDDLRVRRGDLT